MLVEYEKATTYFIHEFVTYIIKKTIVGDHGL